MNKELIKKLDYLERKIWSGIYCKGGKLYYGVGWIRRFH